MKSNTMLENANKVAYLIQEYPERSLPEIINLLELPGVEINTAIWLATELGWISEPDKDEGAVRFLAAPKDGWQFGDRIETLRDMLVYSFEKLAKKEQDLEENYLSNWTAGYAAQDHMIAMRSLIKENVLATYVVEDGEKGENKYTFYTLAKNADQEWGRKQFKKTPEKAEPTNDEKTEE
jgi:hypothetical protein